jgi:hypothetical protein
MRLLDARTPLAVGAATCAAAAIAAFGLALFRAVTLEPLPVPRTSSTIPGPGAAVKARAALPVQVIARAVGRDPFRADRQPPRTRFRMPGEAAPGERDSAETVGDLRLIGTAVVGQGGFAVCQAGAAVPQVVRLGQSLGGYTLASVSRGRAVFRDSDGKVLELRVPRAGGS